MKKKLLSLIFALVSAHAMADGTVGQPWIDGQNFGMSMLGSEAGSITTNNATAINSLSNNFNSPNTVSGLQNTFGASNQGNIGLASFGNNKVKDCASYVPDPSRPADNNDCMVVNMLAKQPTQNALSTTGLNQNDPMITDQNNAYNQGLRTKLSIDLGGGTPQVSVGSSTCAQTSTQTPPTVTEESCTRTVSNTVQGCTTKLGIKIITPQPITATPVFNCPAGATPQNTTSCSSPIPAGYACVGPIGATCASASFPASVNYQCTPGSALNGTQCQPAPSQATLSYSCVSGTLSGSVCLQPTTSANLTYSCPAGGTLQGSTCYPAPGSGTYSCPSGGTLSGTSCINPTIQGTPIAATSTTVTGPPSIVTGGFFLKQHQLYMLTPEYMCGSRGYNTVISFSVKRGSNNRYGDFYKATAVCANSQTAYSCPSGYSLSGTTCYPSPVTPPPTQATYTPASPYSASANYSCPAGASLSGASCVYPATQATSSYSCPAGTSLNGGNCYPPPVGATVVYTCPSGTTQNGTSCTPPNTTPEITYTCPPGATMSGTSCIMPVEAQTSLANGCAVLQSKSISCTSTSCTCPGNGTWNGILPPGAAACQ